MADAAASDARAADCPLRLQPAALGARALITLDSDGLAELGLVAVGDDAQDPAQKVRVLLEDALKAVTMPAGLRPGVESDDNKDGCFLRLALIGPDGLETSRGWEEVRGGAFTASVPAAVEYGRRAQRPARVWRPARSASKHPAGRTARRPADDGRARQR